MKSKITTAIIALIIGMSLSAQQSDNDYLAKMNKILPHKFKELKTGVTLDVVREQNAVKLYMLIDDIEQYDQILIERSDEQQKNYSQCKVIQIQKGKYKNNYLEVTDQYPLPPTMPIMYRVKTVTSEGITRMFPPVPIASTSDKTGK